MNLHLLLVLPYKLTHMKDRSSRSYMGPSRIRIQQQDAVGRDLNLSFSHAPRPVVPVKQCHDDLSSLITLLRKCSYGWELSPRRVVGFISVQPYPALCLILGGECFICFLFHTSQDTLLTPSAYHLGHSL
jgi:hypothetical protein